MLKLNLSVFILSIGLLSASAYAEQHGGASKAAQRQQASTFPETIIPATEGYKATGRWVMKNGDKFYQYKDGNDVWQYARNFFVADTDGKYVDHEGTMHYLADDIIFQDSNKLWHKARKTDDKKVIESDEQEEIFASGAYKYRPNLKRDARLDEAARERAKQIAKRFAHNDGMGHGSNYYVKKYNFPSPNFADTGNQVESIQTGTCDGATAWNGLSHHPGHDVHLQGRGIWANHTHFGVGKFQISERMCGWVFLSSNVAN